jgi:adenine deaminase
MLTPSEFARVATVHGTIAAVSDPHEIANVLGINGVRYMIEDAEHVPFKFYFSAPSCVPATSFETSGAALGPEEVGKLLKLDKIKYLGEVMNFPGVLNNDPDIMKKIEYAEKYSKKIDGHAPGLRGTDLTRYATSGITTNHECLSLPEAMEDIGNGIKVQIRKGSAADIFEECIPILREHHDSCMFCSDDKHPDDLAKGYINEMVLKAIGYGIDPLKVFKVASANPVLHYGLDVGLLRVGDSADFLEINSLTDVNVIRTWINGEICAERGETRIARRRSGVVNHFRAKQKKVSDFKFPFKGGTMPVIEAVDGQVVTGKLVTNPRVEGGNAVSDSERDILKITVVNRYEDKKPAIAFVKNFGLKKGAIASSVAHDCHNIVAVGVTDEDLSRAVNLVIRNKGGICAVSDGEEMILPLPIAGIMSNEDYMTVSSLYTNIDRKAKAMGSRLHAPFMTLSFMALLVIPRLKLSDRGLFDGEKFAFVNEC